MFFFSHRLPPKAVKRCPHIGYREMQRQVEDQLGPSFSHHVHPAASPTVKPESHDPPPLCAWGERQWSRSRGAPRSNLVAQPVGTSGWTRQHPGQGHPTQSYILASPVTQWLVARPCAGGD